jgi:uncharacterized membrane protein
LWQACRWGALLLLCIGYAVLSHLAAAAKTPDRFDALIAVLPLLVLAFAMAWRSPWRTAMLGVCLAGCGLLLGFSGWLVARYNWVFLLQHAGIHALLCFAFGRTLQAGHTPMIGRFAAVVHGKLTPALVSYTRSATWAWSLYFGATSATSLLLFWLAPVSVWSAFANLLSGVLLALMFAGEYAVRCRVLPAADRAGPLEAIRAYRQAASAGGAARQP